MRKQILLLILFLVWTLAPKPANGQTSQEYGISVTPVHPQPGLKIEVWTNKGKGGTFYLGEDLVVYFRTNMDCYVLIYEVDTEGYLHVIYPHDPYEDCFVKGEVTYRVPHPDLDYRFRVCGPQGEELIYAVASPDLVTPPRWLPYRSEGDYDPHWYAHTQEERFDLLDKVNFRIFEDGYFVDDWCVFEIENLHHHFYRPLTHYRYYPVGGIWVDCSWYGGEVFVDGVFWGYAPLWIPNIFVGPHIIIVYQYGYPCWQRYVYVERYRPVRVRVDTHKFERRRYKGDYFRDYDWGGKRYKDRPSWASPGSSPSEGKFARRHKIGSKSTYTPPQRTALARSSDSEYIRSKAVRSATKTSVQASSLRSGEEKRAARYPQKRSYKPKKTEKPKAVKLTEAKSRTYSRADHKKERSSPTVKRGDLRANKVTSGAPKSTRAKVTRRR